MTNKEILQIALQQSAEDWNCQSEDFLQECPVIVEEYLGEKARKYLKEPIPCNLISYGNNVVVSVKSEYRHIVEEYVRKFENYRCFEIPNLYWLNEQFEPFGYKVCFMASFYLPDMRKLKKLPCDYELKLLTQKDFEPLYTGEWDNALCENRKECDVLGVGAYDNGKLIGLAACSADCDTMWQIGVDVLPEYRRKGIATAVVSHLAVGILERGKVPFYCCAWSNVRSMKTAVKCGFVPSWTELTVKPNKVIADINGE